jgi:hypothetical protein
MRYRAEDFAPRRHIGGDARLALSPTPTSSPGTSGPRRSTGYGARWATTRRSPPHSGPYPARPSRMSPRSRTCASCGSAAGPAPRAAAARRRSRRWLARASDALGRLPRHHGRQDGRRERRAGRGAEHPNVSCAPASRSSGWKPTQGGRITALLTSAGRITAAGRAGRGRRPHARRCSCARRPSASRGAGNRSGQVGRNFMNHNASACWRCPAAQPDGLPEDALSQRLVQRRRPERRAARQRAASGPRLGPDPCGAVRPAEGRWRKLDLRPCHRLLRDVRGPARPESRVTLSGEAIVLNWRGRTGRRMSAGDGGSRRR